MKIFKSLFLVALILFFASWFYKIMMLMVLAHLWRKEIKTKKDWGYKAIMVGLQASSRLKVFKSSFMTNGRTGLPTRICVWQMRPAMRATFVSLLT